MLISANTVLDAKEISELSDEAECSYNFLALGAQLEGCGVIQFGGGYFC